MGSTSHLINEQGNEVRDHSSTDGRIVVSTVLPTLGCPPLIWDQWDWSGTSSRSCTYYDADFGSAETGLGPVVHTPRLTSCQCRTGLGPVRVVPTMTLTLGWLRLVWDQWYALWVWLRVSGEWYETFSINSYLHKYLSESDDLWINPTPLDERNPIKISATINKLTHMEFGPSFQFNTPSQLGETPSIDP